MEPSLSDNVLLAQIKYLKNGQSHFQNHYQYVSQGFQLSPVKWKNRYLFIKHRCESSLEKMCVSCDSIFTFYSMRKNGTIANCNDEPRDFPNIYLIVSFQRFHLSYNWH